MQKESKHLLLSLGLCLLSVVVNASQLTLTGDKVDTADEVYSINHNFSELYSGKLDLRPGDVLPRTDNYYSLGSANYRWKNIYVSSITAANVICSSTMTIDGTTFMVNCVTDKVFFGGLGGFGTTEYMQIGNQDYGRFWVSTSSQKVIARSLRLHEINDTVDIAIRRFDGTLAAPTVPVAEEFIGAIHWSPMGADGALSTVSPHYGRSAQIGAQLVTNSTWSNTPGSLIFYTTPRNDDQTYPRGFFSSDGCFMALGGSYHEWANSVSFYATTVNMHAGATKMYDQPNCGMFVASPPLTSTQTALMVASPYNSDYHFDLDYDSATLTGKLSMTTANTKTGVLYISTTARVGIGTSSPRRPLHAVGPSGQVASFPTIGANTVAIFENNTNANISIISAGSSASAISWAESGDASSRGTLQFSPTAPYKFNHIVNGVTSVIVSSTTMSLPTAAAIRGTLLPTREGDVVYNSTDHYVCVATGTTVNTWAQIHAPTTACGH